MLSSCGGRLLSGGGGGGGGDRAQASSSSSSGSSSRRLHASQVELLISSTSSNSLSDPLDAPRSLLSGDRVLLTNSGALNHQWQQQQQHQQVRQGDKQDEFVGANGVVFTLSNNRHHHQEASQYSLDNVNVMPRRDDSLAQKQQQQQQPPPPPLPKGNGHLDSSSIQPKPLHRHLQYRPIHQQLQRIYGNKLQEFEQLNKQQHHNDTRKQATTMIKQQEQHVFAIDGRLHQERYQHHQHHHHHHLQYHQQQQHQPPDQALLYQHEQTYDSLNVVEPPPPPPPSLSQSRHQHQASRKQAPQSFYEFNSQASLASRPIRAIPEESSRLDQNNNIIMSKKVEDDDDDHHHHQEQEEDEDELAEDEEQGFLLQNDARRIARQSSQVLMNSRKKQMESLHYATATAAALLNVTASAAAAFAVSDKHLIDQQQQPSQRQQSRLIKPNRRFDSSPPVPTTANGRDPRIYTNGPQNGGGKAQQMGQYQQLYDHGANYSEQMRHNQQLRQLNQNQNQQRQQQAQHRPSMRGQRPTNVRQADIDLYGAVYNQQQSQAGVMRSANHMQQMPAMVRPAQSAQQQIMLRPGGGVPLTNQQLELLRRYKQQQMQLQKTSAKQVPVAIYGGINSNNKQQQAPVPAALALAANGAPALAILQPRAKPVDSNYMARLAANHKQQQLMVAASASLNPQLLMLAPGQIQNGTANMQNETRYHQQQQQQQQVTYGLLMAAAAAAARGNKQQQPIYGPSRLQLKNQPEQPVARSHYHIGAITSNSSDASGHSNLPLILNGGVAKPKLGLIDKISRIDLTIFWWVLLTICVLFITAGVAITRYLI